ncbi:putative protein 13 [Rhizopogon vesiculosus]|uniref:Homeobox domain-containing protein n=1 Tax=Rhizopogon vesiculosus TaxID=180088 RepID=A0A1J8R1P7_9AGAM|nr:putative protein 13 [Rhizopogon vesiculosus]
MHIIIPPIATSIRTRRATTSTPDQDRDVKENLSSTPSLNASQPSPEVRSKDLSSRKRNRMSSAQLARLESLFQKETHPSKEKKRELADEIGVSYRTLTVWFQNKRQVVKRNGGNVSPPSQLRKGVSQTPPDQHVTQSPSIFQRVSSPSMDNNLQPTSLQQVSTANLRTTNSPGKQGTDVNNPPLKSTEVKPLLISLASFIAYKSPPSMTSHGKDQAQLESPASRISAQELWRHLSSSPATPSLTSDRGSKARDPARDEDETPCGKRRMTLEWACNRETKRRRGESHHSSDTDNLSSFWVGPSSQSITSALSLLLFARGKVSKSSPAGSAPSPDVIRGASLLLSLKHSLRRRNAEK